MRGPSDSSRHFPSFRCKFFRAFCPSFFFFFFCVSAPFVMHRHNFSFTAPIVPCILHRQFRRGSYLRSVSNRPCLSTRILLSTFPRLSSLLSVPPPPVVSRRPCRSLFPCSALTAPAARVFPVRGRAYRVYRLRDTRWKPSCPSTFSVAILRDADDSYE